MINVSFIEMVSFCVLLLCPTAEETKIVSKYFVQIKICF